jgi:hypothetical protein
MTANHTHFESLCALAASGQLTKVELAELHEHSEECPICSDQITELAQVSAGLFCAHVGKQPRGRMPNGMLERFIARANREGVPLDPRAKGTVLSGPALTAAFVFALFLVSLTLHLGSRTRSGDETVRSESLSLSRAMSDKGEAAPRSRGTMASGVQQTGIARARSRGRGSLFVVSHAEGHRSVFPADSGIGQRQFDLSLDPRSLAILRLPFIVDAHPDENIQRAPVRYGAPEFPLMEPSEFAKEDAPQLLAGYERRTFAMGGAKDSLAFEPADLQGLRRDFEPDANRTLLTPDFKRNLPALQFSESMQQ